MIKMFEEYNYDQYYYKLDNHPAIDNIMPLYDRSLLEDLRDKLFRRYGSIYYTKPSVRLHLSGYSWNVCRQTEEFYDCVLMTRYDCDDIEVYIYPDDWYVVECLMGDDIVNYKCDQLDGLYKFLDKTVEGFKNVVNESFEYYYKLDNHPVIDGLKPLYNINNLVNLRNKLLNRYKKYFNLIDLYLSDNSPSQLYRPLNMPWEESVKKDCVLILSDYDEIEVYIYPDDWYIVEIINRPTMFSRRISCYKCDQLDGLYKFLDNYIANKS